MFPRVSEIYPYYNKITIRKWDKFVNLIFPEEFCGIMTTQNCNIDALWDQLAVSG